MHMLLNMCALQINATLDPDGRTGRQIPTQSILLKLWVCATTPNEDADDES